MKIVIRTRHAGPKLRRLLLSIGPSDDVVLVVDGDRIISEFSHIPQILTMASEDAALSGSRTLTVAMQEFAGQDIFLLDDDMVMSFADCGWIDDNKSVDNSIASRIVFSRDLPEQEEPGIGHLFRIRDFAKSMGNVDQVQLCFRGHSIFSTLESGSFEGNATDEWCYSVKRNPSLIRMGYFTPSIIFNVVPIDNCMPMWTRNDDTFAHERWCMLGRKTLWVPSQILHLKDRARIPRLDVLSEYEVSVLLRQGQFPHTIEMAHLCEVPPVRTWEWLQKNELPFFDGAQGLQTPLAAGR